jgi:uncharacterized protein (TIGR02246 family)
MMLTMGENEVRALYDKLIAAWNDHDGDAMAEPFAADGVVIGFDGSVSSGAQTISTDMSRIFADHETGRYAVNSPKSSTASGRLCCSKTLPLNSTAALAWSRT